MKLAARSEPCLVLFLAIFSVAVVQFSLQAVS
ncbi:hypothetical protein FOMG_19075 [Fusarium oxysporum f. sp. melonis 26406]|uniref:Uncharacterized protein n=1 Tax=Fusarium oxysporum f. sp. melonis 26406 TaxID=1089452 RepID=W9YXA3_FUSOX|nr:hypothetical protein FOMG_19075 [Fusarium oxysporum f. sp. melonis 26406]